MSLAQFCVRRPVATSMVYLGLVLLGIISWAKMPRELFPSISFPQLTVVTRYGNAAPEEIENLITKIIEEAVGTVPNLKRIRSLSKEGVSLVTLEFNWGTDMGFAHLSAREKIDQIKDRLPSEAEEPIINRTNPFAQPMMIYSVSGELPLWGLTDVTKKVIKQRLEKVDGVASATISGGDEREIRVLVDRGRLEASKISLGGVVDALKNTNLDYPAGTTQGKFYEYLIRTIGTFKNIDEIGRTVVEVEKANDREDGPPKDLEATRASRPVNARFIHLEAMAEVIDTFKERSSHSRYNGHENVSLAIQKQADANTVDTAVRVRRAMRELDNSLPDKVRVELVYDESVFIKKAVNGVFMDALVGGVLAFLVLYFFLRSFSDASIVATAIPVSTFIIFVAMYFKGISINMLSLAGLGLAIGNLVDNSIVVVENTARARAEGKDPKAGAIQGAEEVGNSMVTASLTNVAVILPLLFAGGVAEQLFMDLFFASVGASIISMIVSLTLIPRLAAHPIRLGDFFARFRQPSAAPAGATSAPGSDGSASGGEPASRLRQGVAVFKAGLSDETFGGVVGLYRSILGWVVDNPKKVGVLLAGLMVFSAGIILFHEKVFMPKFDQGQFVVRVNMPVGTRLDITNNVMGKIEAAAREVRGVRDLMASVGSSNSDSPEALGSHQAQCVINLDEGRFRRSTEDVIADLEKSLEALNLEGAEVQFVLQDSILSTAFETSAPIVIEIKGPDLATLKKISQDIAMEIEGIPGTFGVKSSFALPSSETRVSIDKEKAAGYQLSVSDIARVALIGIKGYIATTYKEAGQEVNVRVQLRPQDRQTVDDIRRLSVRAPSGVMVPLAEIASLDAGQGPSEIKRLDQQRAIVVTANVLKRSVDDVIEDVEEKLAAYGHLNDYNITLSGESAQVKESFGGLAVAMLFSILLIYMIMAAEFESFPQPLIIMTTVPFCLVGVALTLFVTRTPLSAPVILGTIILGGLVVNNGIILIDFMNQMRREGATDLREVVINAGATRLRPILMTMLVSILGVLPMALGLSEGSELSSPMAIVTFGGLLISACLSLFIIPALYYHFETWRLNRAAQDAAPAGAPEEGNADRQRFGSGA